LNAVVGDYNAACDDSVPFEVGVKDGKRTHGLGLEKTNWSQKLDSPPFIGYPVTSGLTFTYGGVKINRRAEVLDTEDNVIQGLYAAGELTGGFFYFNYPGASGLMRGAVTGRISGTNAGRRALGREPWTP
jgi:tricarballylate dehydrogenase